jgi:TPR repeat protein
MKQGTKAKSLLCDSELEKFYVLIENMMEESDADTLYFYSCFCLRKCNETDEMFKRRRWALLLKAAEAGSPDALYGLAMCYFAGDNVTRDGEKASSLFKQAAEKGHAESKFEYGLDLYYGANGCTKNEKQGFEYIQDAYKYGIKEAGNVLEEIKLLVPKLQFGNAYC